MVKRILSFILIGLLLAATPLWAAQVTAVADRNRIGEGDSLHLELRVQGKPAADPDLNVLRQDWDILNRSRNSQVQIVNGDFTRSLVISLTLMPKRSGEVKIPAVCFGSDCSLPLPIQVSTQPLATSAGDELLLEADVEPKQVLVGQQVVLTIRVLHRGTLTSASLNNVQPQGVPADIQPLGEDRNFETNRDGYHYQGIERRYALFPQQAGELLLPRLTLQAQVASADGFGAFGTSTRNLRRFSPALTVQVAAQPANGNGRLWLPATAVTLTDSWQHQSPQFRVGEPVTRTLTLQVTGLPAAHLPDLSLPLPSGWKSYPDQPVRNDSDASSGVVGTLEQKIAVVPTAAGTLKLPGFDLDWYDVNSGQWQVAKVAPLSVTVAPAAPGSVSQPPPSVAPPAPAPAQSAPPESAPAPVPQPKPAAQASPTHQISPWLWVSCGLAIGWLLTLLWWWQQRRRQPQGRVDSIPEKPLEVRERDAFKQLLVAARSNDPAATRQALVVWGRSRWPERCSNLEQLALLLDEPLQILIENLSRELYSKTAGAWQGEDLMRELQRWRGQKVEKGKTVDLPPLYPAGKPGSREPL